jgi:hypothetical protein
MTTDPALSLTTLDALAGYLAAAFESGDAAILTDAFAVAARAEGTTHLAAAAGIPQLDDVGDHEGDRFAYAGGGALKAMLVRCACVR